MVLDNFAPSGFEFWLGEGGSGSVMYCNALMVSDYQEFKKAKNRKSGRAYHAHAQHAESQLALATAIADL